MSASARHGCGYKLLNHGHDTRALQHYLGHRNIQHPVLLASLMGGDVTLDFMMMCYTAAERK